MNFDKGAIYNLHTMVPSGDMQTVRILEVTGLGIRVRTVKDRERFYPHTSYYYYEKTNN